MTITRTAWSGLELPAIGFGTYKLNGERGVDAVIDAVRNGYRLLDSAFNYENEGAVGRAARAAGVPREDLIVTSKLPGRRHDHEQAVAAIEESLFRSGLDYLDLYLIHWPNPRAGRYVEAWRALIDAKERGLVRAIGVCNFLPEHIERLARDTGVLPEVNQVELHPYFPQVEALAFHRERGIITESWSPLGRGTDLLRNPEIQEIADAHDVSPAQVVLSWHIHRGAIPIPKAASSDRQRENLRSVEVALSDAEVARLTALGRPDGRIAGQDPATYEEF